MPQTPIGFDFETWPIQPDFVAPPPICLSLACQDAGFGGHLDHINTEQALVRWNEQFSVFEFMIGNDYPEEFGKILSSIADDENVFLVGANTAYDTVVATYHDPVRCISSFFRAYEAGRIADVIIREKLRRLSTTGNLETMRIGSDYIPLKYDLATLETNYLGIDRSAEKTDLDAWRLRYYELDGVNVNAYPALAIEYAMADARGALLVWQRQEAKRTPRMHGSMNTQALQTQTDYALFLMTCYGLLIDKDQVAKLSKALDDVLSPEAHQPLYDAGFLEPAIPEHIQINQRTGKPIICHKGPNKDQIKVVGAKPETAKNKKIQEYVMQLCETACRYVERTDNGGIKIDADTLSQLTRLDTEGLLGIYATRQEHLKMRTTYEKALTGNEIIWPGYNVLVSTGRTSSRGFKRGKELYPSCNIQNIPRLERGNLNIRSCFCARPGKVLVSIDFSALELCAFAQTTYNLFGHSVHRDKINLGYDLHAFLGAQLCAALDPEFAEVIVDEGLEGDADGIYFAFMEFKGCGNEKLEKLFKHYRTFAKPTGLGYPGGLGADTFIEFARKTYGVIVEDRELAVRLKDLWFQTYPEAEKYLKQWVETQKDDINREDENGNGGYCYTSPLGMFRANSNYCATANGKALQTPSAEGAKIAIFSLMRRCIDPAMEDPLFGKAMLWAYVHDEIIFEIDVEHAAELAPYASKLMRQSMAKIIPDVKLVADPSYMFHWLKGAHGLDVVWDMDADGKLFSVPLASLKKGT